MLTGLHHIALGVSGGWDCFKVRVSGPITPGLTGLAGKVP